MYEQKQEGEKQGVENLGVENQGQYNNKELNIDYNMMNKILDYDWLNDKEV